MPFCLLPNTSPNASQKLQMLSDQGHRSVFDRFVIIWWRGDHSTKPRSCDSQDGGLTSLKINGLSLSLISSFNNQITTALCFLRFLIHPVKFWYVDVIFFLRSLKIVIYECCSNKLIKHGGW